MDCIFCKIISGEIPTTKVYEDDKVIAFNDIEPQAPVHILIIPKEHIASANELTEENASIVGHIFAVAAKIAKEEGILATDDEMKKALADYMKTYNVTQESELSSHMGQYYLADIEFEIIMSKVKDKILYFAKLNLK